MSKSLKDEATTEKYERKFHFDLDDTVLPELKNLEVGKEATITLRVKLKSKKEGHEFYDEGDDENPHRLSGSFEVCKASKETKVIPELEAAKKIMAKKKQPRHI